MWWWYDIKKRKSKAVLISHMWPLLCRACPAQRAFVSACRGALPIGSLARQGHCMALSVPWSNVGKTATSQVLNRVFIVLRPGDDGEGEGQDSHTTSDLLYFLVDVSWKGWERHLWVDGTKKDLGLYRVQVQEICIKCKKNIYIYINNMNYIYNVYDLYNSYHLICT